MARMVHVRIKASNGARSGTRAFSDDKMVAPLLDTPTVHAVIKFQPAIERGDSNWLTFQPTIAINTKPHYIASVNYKHSLD